MNSQSWRDELFRALTGRDFTDVYNSIQEIVTNPASDPQAAFLLLAIVILAVGILFSIVLMFVIGRSEDIVEIIEVPVEGDELGAAGEPGEGGEYDGGQPRGEGAADAGSAAATAPARTRRRLPAIVVIAGVLLAWWAATGVGTAQTSTCESCHEQAHVTEGVDDPHADEPCIACHDAGTFTAAVVGGTPARVSHIAAGLAEAKTTTYGRVSSDACARCHNEDLSVTLHDEQKRVKVSHKEPLAAGAECMDCHLVQDGAIDELTKGMTPCLRCHNGTDASAACESCHTADVGTAISARSRPSPEVAKPLIVTPDCGGCHNVAAQCDTCHGIRMPHSEQFKAYAHARPGVEDIWYNGGKTCGKCHTPERRSCRNCHKGEFSSHGLDFRKTHMGDGVTGSGCDTCHAEMAFRQGRRFCIDLCHSDAVQQ